MTHRALAVPFKRASQDLSPHTRSDAPLDISALAAKQAAAVSLGVALRYLALRRARLVKPSVPLQCPVLRVVT